MGQEHVHTSGVGLGDLPHPGINILNVAYLHLQLRSAGAQVIQDLVCDAGALSSLDLSDNGEATREPIHIPIIHPIDSQGGDPALAALTCASP